MHTKRKDYTGKTFGLLTVLGDGEDLLQGQKKLHKRTLRCRCECGNVVDLRCDIVISERKGHCGCKTKEKLSKRFLTHGLHNTPIYWVWDSMKKRCFRKKDKNYPRYGGRGIVMCDEWKEDITVFYKWCIDNGWEKGLHIDRIDNNLGYSPDNCRIVTPQQNCWNSCGSSPKNEKTSKYKGVSKDPSKEGVWRVFIGAENKTECYEPFYSEVEAANFYDTVIFEMRGEYAWLNRDYFKEVMDEFQRIKELGD